MIGTYGYTYKTGKPLSDNEIYQLGAEYAENHSTEKPCTFCKREGIDPPASGSKATGSYRDVGAWDVSRPKVFNGYLCDMHRDNVEWVSFRWQ